MKIVKHLFFLLLLSANGVFAQNILKVPESISLQIPKNWTVIEHVRGDINKDKRLDSVVVLENKTIPDIPRKIMVFTLTQENKYHLFAENDFAAFCEQCGGMMGDPYQGIDVKSGVLKIYNMGGSSWRWTHHLTFNYSRIDNQLQLVKQEQSSFHSSEPNKSKNTIKTPKLFGKVNFSDFKTDN